MDVFYQIPPVTRTLVATTVATSLGVHSNIIPIARVAFLTQKALFSFPPQVWRLATSFFVTGGGLSILFDPYFLYTCGIALETDSPRFPEKGDFAWYIAFNMAVILLLSGGILGNYLFLRPLIMSFAYTYAQDNPQRKINFMVMPVQARFLPYVMLLLALVMGSPMAMVAELTGLLSAHMHDFLTRIWPSSGGGRNWLKTPSFVKHFFGETGRSGPTTRAYGTAYAAARPSTTATGSWSSGWGGPWSSRGTGRRLGGD